MTFPVSDDSKNDLLRCMAWAARSSRWMTEQKPDRMDRVTVRLEDFLAIASGLDRIRDELAGVLTDDMEPVQAAAPDLGERAAGLGLRVISGGKK